MTEANGSSTAHGRQAWQHRALWMAAPLALAATIAVAAFASCGHGHRFGHRGHGFDDPAEAREHIERHADWMLGRIDATDLQKDRIVAILGDSVDELYGLRTRHREHHDEIVRLFTADEIDREAIESVRAQELALADEASVTIVAAVTDALEVLTPEQRAELREWADHFHR